MTRRDLVEEVRDRVRRSLSTYRIWRIHDGDEVFTEFSNRHSPTRPFIAETLSRFEAQGLFEWVDGQPVLTDDGRIVAAALEAWAGSSEAVAA